MNLISDAVRVASDAVALYGNSAEKIIPILTYIQKRLNYIPEESIVRICRIVDITPCQISEIITFYSRFRRKPTGRHIIRICSGSACKHVGNKTLYTALTEYLQIDSKTNISSDGEFSIEQVDCLGTCAIAPALSIDGNIYGNLSIYKISEVISNFKKTLTSAPAVPNKPMKGDVDAEIRVGIGTCCVSLGSKEVLTRLVELRDKYNLNIRIKPVGCTGACSFSPILQIVDKTGESFYTNVSSEQVELIILKNFPTWQMINDLNEKYCNKHNNIDAVPEMVYESSIDAAEDLIMPTKIYEDDLRRWLASQLHIATTHSGELSPVSLTEYMRYGGTEDFRQALSLKAEEVIKRIEINGVRENGRGNSVSEAWKIYADKQDSEATKYIVCYCEDGETGSHKDRALIESSPFKIIEGMLIAGYATGTHKGIVNISSLYPLSIKRITNAVNQYIKAGLLGENILGSNFSFEITVVENPGDFISSDDIDEIFDADSLTHSIETLATIPAHFANNARRNTMTISLLGRVNRRGFVEVPITTTINEIINTYGGGICGNKQLKGVHIGGMAGGFLPPSLLNVTLERIGLKIGSGVILVLDENDSIIDMAKHYIGLACKQSCGKCTACRVGTTMMYQLLDKLPTTDKIDSEDKNEIESLATQIKKGSLCNMGKNSINGIESALRYFL